VVGWGKHAKMTRSPILACIFIRSGEMLYARPRDVPNDVQGIVFRRWCVKQPNVIVFV